MKTPTLLIALLLLGGSVTTATAQLIVHESFNYTIDTTNPDPDGAGTINAGNGLPATNVDGNPTGTSVGLRGNYGTMHSVVPGLTYSNSGGTLSTSANALKRMTGTSYGTDVWMYRNMTTDPFGAYRAVGSTNWLGYRTDKTTALYFSVLVNASSVNTTTNNRLVLWLGLNNWQFASFIGQPNGGTDWVYADQLGIVKTLGTAIAGQTEFIVGKLTFESATSAKIEVWFNPTLGTELGTPTISQGYSNNTWGGGNQTNPWTLGGDFRGLNTRDGAGVLTYDEFRLGLSAADVMPVVGISTEVTSASGNSDVKVKKLATHSFVAEINQPEDCVSIDILTLSGTRVQTLNNIQASNLINLKEKGMYLMVVNRTQSKETVKLLNF